MGALENKPYIVSWNLTRRCNLLCPHCYIEAGSSPSPELTQDEAKSVIDELSRLNSKLMLVLSGGEPMLRKDIFDIVEYSARAGFIPVMGSNGTLLTRENIRALKNAGLRGIGISIDSVHPESHDAFRGLEGAWDLSVSALRAAKEEGLETQLDITLADRNWKEIGAFVEFAASLGARAANFFFLVCTGRAMKTTITTENYDSAITEIARVSAKERRLMVRGRCAPHIYRRLHQDGVSLPAGTRGCLAGRSYMRVDPEGNVSPCPYMSLSVGNIKEQSLTSIWEGSPVLNQLRQGAYHGRCGACEYREFCGGCRARALADSGDLLGEDPLCSYVPMGKDTVKLSAALATDHVWDERAQERIKKIPVFMRGMIVKMIEAKARERGVGVITSEMIDELKTQGYPGKH